MSDILAIAIAEKKATMKLMTQGCQTVEDVERKIDEYFDTVAKYAKELFDYDDDIATAEDIRDIEQARQELADGKAVTWDSIL
ncbi:MAG: hypothetical protein FWG87_11060 [Defluviitaleaceae bacterium]|nr:hypothetical protein [Defluviitaleaceae bacterium]